MSSNVTEDGPAVRERFEPGPVPARRDRSGAGSAGGVADRARAEIRRLAPAIAGYAAVRATGVLLLLIWASHRGRGLGALLAHRSDSVWYINLVQHGYDSGHGQSNMAFFPLYPLLVRAIAAVSPVGIWWTAIGVSWLASLACAAALYKVGAHVRDHRTGVMLAVLWGIVPHGIVESLAYTETLFTALTAWCLYALMTRRWIVAGLLCLFAGLTRPTASALIAVVGFAAVVALVRRTDGWRPWLAVILAPLGWTGYLAWVAHRTGRLDGWFHIQRSGWYMSWDGGAYTARTVGSLLDKPAPLDSYLVAMVVLIAIALLVLMIVDRLPWTLIVYSALVLVTSLGAAGYFNAKARFLLPAFGLLLPVATALAKSARAKAWTVVALLAVISAWCGGYLLLVWPHSP